MNHSIKGVFFGLLGGSGISLLFNIMLFYSIIPVDHLKILIPLSVVFTIVGCGKVYHYHKLDKNKDIKG